jgi:flagellar M-ring protein FliF
VAASLDPKEIFTQLVDRYVKLPVAQKVALPVLLIFCVWAIVYTSQVATRPEYSVLYSDLSTADAGAVVGRLKEMKIAYRLDGNSVSVSPPSQVHELRLSLASEGLPKTGSVGFELFDGTNFATTTLGEMVKKQRATQGELERTIMSLDAVMAARVHISQPEKTIFTKDAPKAGASVFLKLRPGTELDKKQIKGIAFFVSSGVEGLTPDNVTIIDEYGNLLTFKNDEGDALGEETTRLQYIREVESGYASRIESMLAKVLGPGKVIARVTADLDFSSNEREEESYDPGGKVMRSERSIEEGTATTQRGGVPGVVSNLTNDPRANTAPENPSDENSRRESVKNYEISRAITRSSQARGKLLRLSAAVLVDGKSIEVVSTTESEDNGAKQYAPLSPEVLAQVEGIVKSAIGFDSTRGDVVTVENVPFFEPDAGLREELAKAHQTDQYLKYGGLLVPVVALLLFILFVLRPLVKFLTTPTQQEIDLAKLLPSDFVSADEIAEQKRAALEHQQAGGDMKSEEGTAGDGEKKSKIEGVDPTADLEQFEEIIAENVRLVNENPQQAALLIRYWLNDGKI